MKGICTVAMTMGMVLAQGAQTPITVALFDIAGVRPEILELMKTETSGIFRAAAVELKWVDCARDGKPIENSECFVQFGPSRLMLQLVPGTNKKTPRAAGLALVRDGASFFAYVYPQRVQELARDANWGFPDLLGHAAAHELGHLVLRSGSHTEAGLMRAKWEAHDLRGLAHRLLVFLEGQLQGVQITQLHPQSNLCDPDARTLTVLTSGDIATVPLAVVVRAKEMASNVLAGANISVNWTNQRRRVDEVATACGESLTITFDAIAPEGSTTNAKAYAIVSAGSPAAIHIFYDRVAAYRDSLQMPGFLGHVIAHEIVHVLQGVARHSREGVMKANWDLSDCAGMLRGPLPFEVEDLELIGSHFQRRSVTASNR